MRRTRNKYSSVNSQPNKFLSFLQRNWVGITIALLLILFVLPFVVMKLQNVIQNIKNNKVDNETKALINQTENSTVQNNVQNTNLSNIDLTSKAGQIKKKFSKRFVKGSKLFDQIKNDAYNLAIALGTDAKSNQAWFGLEGWLPDRPDLDSLTEDEKTAGDILVKYPRTFDILAECYFKLATRSHDLRKDINKYLTNQQIKNLRLWYKKHGQTWI